MRLTLLRYELCGLFTRLGGLLCEVYGLPCEDARILRPPTRLCKTFYSGLLRPDCTTATRNLLVAARVSLPAERECLPAKHEWLCARYKSFPARHKSFPAGRESFPARRVCLPAGDVSFSAKPCFLTLQRLSCPHTPRNKAITPRNDATHPQPKPKTPRKSPTQLPPQPSRYASPRHSASFARAFSANGDSICSKISSAAST
jgi:hypothetical protein